MHRLAVTSAYPGGGWLRLSVPPEVRPNVRIDFIAATLYGAFGGLTVPFLTVMGRRLGASALGVSLLVAAPAIVLLLSFWVVNLIRPLHPVRLVLWFHLVGRMMFLLMPVVDTAGAYVALIILYHAIGSIGQLGYAQVMRAVYPADLRGRIMALVRIGMAMAWVAGSLIGGRLMQVIDFRWVFAGAGVLGMGSAIVFRRVQLPAVFEEPERVDLRRTWQILTSDRAFRRFLTGFFVFGFGGWLIGPAVPILLVDELRATSLQVGLLGAVTSGMWLLSYYAWGRTIDRRTATVALRIVFVIGTATPLIYLLAPNAWVVLLAGITDGLASAGIDLGWLTAVLDYAPAGLVPHYIAIFNTSVGIRASTAPFLAGALIPYIGARWIFALGMAAMLVGTWIMRRVPALPSYQREAPAEPAPSQVEGSAGEGPAPHDQSSTE